jgi:hypothetical protein
MAKIKESFDCITVGCNGKLEFKGKDDENGPIFYCQNCKIVIAVVSSPRNPEKLENNFKGGE